MLIPKLLIFSLHFCNSAVLLQNQIIRTHLFPGIPAIQILLLLRKLFRVLCRSVFVKFFFFHCTNTFSFYFLCLYSRLQHHANSMPLLRSGHFCAILSHTTDFSPFIRSATALQKRIRSDSRPDPRRKETVPFSGWQGRSGW